MKFGNLSPKFCSHLAVISRPRITILSDPSSRLTTYGEGVAFTE